MAGTKLMQNLVFLHGTIRMVYCMYMDAINCGGSSRLAFLLQCVCNLASAGVRAISNRTLQYYRHQHQQQLQWCQKCTFQYLKIILSFRSWSVSW